MSEPPEGVTLPRPDETLAALRPVPGEWETVTDETVVSDVAGADGQPGTREDHVLHLCRAAAG